VFRMPLLVQGVHHTASHCFATPSTQATSLLVVVSLTVRFAVELVERSSAEGLLTILTHEVFGVPLVTEGVDTFAFDGLIASSTPGAERVVETIVTVWTSLLLEKGATREGSETLSTNEVLHVPFAVESSDATTSDRLITVSTARAEELLVALLTVGDPVLLVEVASTERHLTVATHEVLWMEGTVEGLYHFTENWLTTVRTVTAR
jgi:hypothetical protein